MAAVAAKDSLVMSLHWAVIGRQVSTQPCPYAIRVNRTCVLRFFVEHEWIGGRRYAWIKVTHMYAKKKKQILLPLCSKFP
jgi:hypothetical protein